MDQQPPSPESRLIEPGDDANTVPEHTRESVGTGRKVRIAIVSLLVAIAAGIGSGVASGVLVFRSIQPDCHFGTDYCGVPEGLLAILIGVALAAVIGFRVGRGTSRGLLPREVADEVYARAILFAVLALPVLFYVIDKSNAIQRLLF